ncbi:hypothetical protein PCANC_11974 [Puccinia coronata f. sp. avenae]|uniref:Uncharacterized protein n=1 Tax=Puccinia coronata f. sp. avenae TaxID=200324 RepID=A0A2N5SX42_9BASI|nr:hypothetical protein PCANC_11974 [Puccinia coronata f. sp. avenae]PLW40836.1 hypothetical protein PCASD_07353 [Puccinia coronata f. sp. avenae]
MLLTWAVMICALACFSPVRPLYIDDIPRRFMSGPLSKKLGYTKHAVTVRHRETEWSGGHSTDAPNGETFI